MQYTINASNRYDLTAYTIEFGDFDTLSIRSSDPGISETHEYIYKNSILGLRVVEDAGKHYLEVGEITFQDPIHKLSPLLNAPEATYTIDSDGTNVRLGFGTEDLRNLRIGPTNLTYDLSLRPVILHAGTSYLHITSFGAEPAIPGTLEGFEATISDN